MVRLHSPQVPKNVYTERTCGEYGRTSRSGFALLGVILVVVVLLAVLGLGLKRLPGSNSQTITNTAKEGSDVIPFQPTPCKPTSGFGNYRTDQSFVINPKNSKELYVNVELKGVHKSLDGGKTWQLASKGLKGWPREDNPNLPCYGERFTIFIDPTNPSHLLLPGGSAPGKISEPHNQTGGLWESLDAGESWHQLFKGDMNAYTLSAATDPRNSKVIYVTTNSMPASNAEADPNEIFVKEGVVYKSVDGGKNWKELLTGFVPFMATTGLFLNPKNPDQLLISTMSRTDYASQYGSKDDKPMGILQTRDGGKTWNIMESIPSDYRSIYFLEVSPANFNNMFVVAQNESGNEKFLYSLDGGISFQETSQRIHIARFNPLDPNGLHLIGFNIYAQPNNLYESFDGGKTWEAIGKLPKEITNDSRASNIVFDPLEKDAIYLNADNAAIWRSVNKGNTWEEILTLEKLPKQ